MQDCAFKLCSTRTLFSVGRRVSILLRGRGCALCGPCRVTLCYALVADTTTTALKRGIGCACGSLTKSANTLSVPLAPQRMDFHFRAYANTALRGGWSTGLGVDGVCCVSPVAALGVAQASGRAGGPPG